MNGRSTTVTGTKFKLPHMRTTSSDLGQDLAVPGLVDDAICVCEQFCRKRDYSLYFATYSDVEVIRSDRFVNFKNRISLTLHLPIFVAEFTATNIGKCNVNEILFLKLTNLSLRITSTSE